MVLVLPPKYTHIVKSYWQIKYLLDHYSTVKHSIFQMDGIVIKANNHKLRKQMGWTARAPLWAVAWKFPPEHESSEVQHIKFTVGRTGDITPVLEIKPVSIRKKPFLQYRWGVFRT